MADNDNDDWIPLSAPIDLTAFLGDPRLADPESFGDAVRGLRDMGPVTISGCFDDPAFARCACCGGRFRVPADGPVPMLSIAGRPVGVACDPCANALLCDLDTSGGL